MNVRALRRVLEARLDDVDDSVAALTTAATVIDTIYPVGSLYLSTLSTNPATLLGRGTWTAFAAGRVLVGRDGADVDFDVAEETGGAKTVTLSTAQIPSHTHVQNVNTAAGALLGYTTDAATATPGASGYSTAATGGGTSHTNMPPFIVVYIWKRTA